MSELSLIKGFSEAGQDIETPDVTFRKMFHLALRTWPYMKPMLLHLLVIGALAFSGGLTAMITGFVGTDLFSNKVLIGEKLQPLQATVLFVGDDFVTTDPERVSSGKAASKGTKGTKGTKAKGSEASKPDSKTVVPDLDGSQKLTAEQRKTVRNRLIIWGIVGSIIGSLAFMVIPYYTMWIWQSINQNLRVAMVKQAESLSLKYHDNARVGDAIFRVYQDSSMIINLLQSGIITPTMMIYYTLVGLAFMVAFDPLFALLVVITGVPMVWLTVAFTPRIRRKSMANRMANSDLTSRLQEVFTAIKVVKANRAENRIFDRFNADSVKALNTAYFLRMDMVILTALVALLGGATLILTEYIMVKWVVVERETFLGAWAVSFLGFAVWNLGALQIARGRIARLAATGRGLVGVWNRMQDMFIGLERAFFLLDLEPDVVDPENPVAFPVPIQNVNWRGVSFAYNAEQPILKGLDLFAEAGTVTAVVGGTGSGKSTIMSMLLRLYDPNEGQVCVNDVDLKTMTVDDLRANTSIALQKNVLFADTVAKNIAYATTDASREDIIAASRVACANEFIESMPRGYDTELGERGGKLSAGQRQRISIARAIVRDTPILILDEPTASLDARTEHEVLANLAEWGKDRVVFLITHRLSTIRNADQIAFLEDGHVIEQGTHDELMLLNAGRYRAYVEEELAGFGETS
jgi:ATP-binding cassette, subfamily B, bacterial